MPLVFMLLVVTLVVMYLMIVLLSARYEPGEFLVTFRSITYQPDLSSPAEGMLNRYGVWSKVCDKE